MPANDIRIVDLDTYEPTDEEIVSWYALLTAPDQRMWNYDETEPCASTEPQKQVKAFTQWRSRSCGENHPLWAICEGRVVGMIGINRFKAAARRHCGEVGFGVIEAFTHRGIGHRLLYAAIEKARLLGLARLEADCFADNAASIALLHKCGFRDEGSRTGAIRKDGRLRDQRVFGFLL